MNKLPIYEVIQDLKLKLQNNNIAILEAATGAGKSTVVPLELLNESYIKDKKIILLEPRRVAARVVAKQLAKGLNEEVGETVGYKVKLDSMYSKKTKILVVTEAVLIRMIQQDQALEEIALIIFDEFHERNINSDLALAFSLQVQEFLRVDLKLLIMSATLNSLELSSFLNNAPIITSKGRSFEVKNLYLEDNIKVDIATFNSLVIKTIKKALVENKGDILVFLAGVKEINEILNSLSLNDEVLVLPLYSNLSKQKQDLAIEKQNKRKVILATNVAQTSLTIQGVTVVIDTGLEKLSFYNSNTGLNHLEVVFISKQAAIQRAGRAGRLENAVCYRLWHNKKILQESTKPEILRADLTQVILELATWGVDDFSDLRWLDTPSLHLIEDAKELLVELNMIDNNFKITDFGKKAISLGIHPRFAYMILKANKLGFAYEACLLVALLSANSLNSDILSSFITLYEKSLLSSFEKELLKEAQFYFEKLKRVQKVEKQKFTYDFLGVLALFAYPDRLAKQRAKDNTKYKLSNNKGAILNKQSYLFNEEYLVVLKLSAKEQDSFINEAIKIEYKQIETYFSSYIKENRVISYDRENKKILARIKKEFLNLELSIKPTQINKNENLQDLYLEVLRQEGLELLNWDKKAITLKQRAQFINFYDNSLGFDIFEEEKLLNSLESWLGIYMQEMKNIEDFKKFELYNILLNTLTWEQQKKLDDLAPAFFITSNGFKIPIDYSIKEKPKLSVKIQELFGTFECIKLLNGKVDLQIELLSPAFRPIQLTYDLNSFWKNSYEEVKKELKGKYPKHYWPDNPYEAIATKFTKKQMFKS